MADRKDLLIVVTSSGLGEGEVDLGAKLISGFFKVINESEVKPDRIVFLNSGIFLTTEGSPVENAIKAVEEQGTEILSCATCLDYFGRNDKLIVGKATDMKETYDAMAAFSKVVTL